MHIRMIRDLRAGGLPREEVFESFEETYGEELESEHGWPRYYTLLSLVRCAGEEAEQEFIQRFAPTLHPKVKERFREQLIGSISTAA
jgi:hypothetical protein